jgi:hypothetical protein
VIRCGLVVRKRENGHKQSVVFAEDVRGIVDDYRRTKNPIPSFTDAVNELIRKSAREGGS